MIKLLIALCCSLPLVGSVFGQGGIADSLWRVDSVKVVGKTIIVGRGVGVGTRVTTIDKAVIAAAQTKTLSALLLENSAIQIKSMGQGAMSLASLRGTSSSHTQVMWNGISINSPTTASFDLSEVPVFFTDQVEVAHGASVQSGSSGALGGSIGFSTDNSAVEKTKFRVMTEYGSNNTITGGAGVRTTLGGLTLSTRLYYQQSDNNYRYLNKMYSKDKFYEHRESADYRQTGVMQEAYYKRKNGDRLSAVVWWQHDKRSIPQAIITQTSPDETIRNNNIRSFVSYEADRGKHNFKATAVYLNGLFDYKRIFSGMGDEFTRNRISTAIAKGEYATSLGKSIDYGADIIYRFDHVASNKLASNAKDRSTVSSRLFALFKATRRLQIEGQVKGELVNGTVAATYNIGLKYHLVENLLAFKATNAYNHRFPSLNDLYWDKVGNPNLKPERGFSWDATLSLTPHIGNVALTFETTAYLMDIKDWIMWIPVGTGSKWIPVNFDNVQSKGFELGGGVKFALGGTNHHVSGNYAYTHSTNNTGRNDGTQGKQLPYMPRNKWNANYRVTYDRFWASYNISYTDLRFTSADQSYFTPAYTFHNAEIGGRYVWPSGRGLLLTLRVDNMFDNYYESTQYFPMPLRMFSLRAIVEF